MENLNLQWFELVSIIGVTTAAALALHLVMLKSRRRQLELEIVRDALKSHYEAVNAVVDDPALPLATLEFITDFNAAIADEETCNHLTDKLAEPKRPRGNSEAKRDIDFLRKTRPDLADNMHKAVFNGIIAATLRWPGNSAKFQRIIQEIAGDPKKEMQIAHSFTTRRTTTFKMNGSAFQS